MSSGAAVTSGRHARAEWARHLAIRGVVALLGELSGVHLGRRSHPEASRQLAWELCQQLARRSEVTNVCHA